MVEVWAKEGEKQVFENAYEVPNDIILHRDDKPAWIEYNEDGNIIYEGWYKDGNQYRENGPAKICYFENGKPQTEIWIKNGVWHRDDGPAGIEYDKNGTIINEIWYQNDKLHRIDGPAIIEYEKDKVVKVEYYLEGKSYSTKEAFEQAALIYKLNLIKN